MDTFIFILSILTISLVILSVRSQIATENSKEIPAPSESVSVQCGNKNGIASGSIKFEFVQSTILTFNGINYTYVKEPMLTWDEAVSACEANCQVLTSIRNSDEYDFLVKLIDGPKNVSDDIFVGGTDQKNYTFEWIEEGVPFPNSLWWAAEPTNWDGNEHCTAIASHYPGINDVPCSKKIRFICKAIQMQPPSTRTLADKTKDQEQCQPGSQGLDLFNNYKLRLLRNHAFVLIREPALIWDDAARTCAANCAVLSGVPTRSDLDFLMKLLKGHDAAWLGGTDRHDKKYKWIEDSEPIPQFFWAPRHSEKEYGPADHCTELSSKLGSGGNDVICSKKLPFICKFPDTILKPHLLERVPKISVTVFSNQVPVFPVESDGNPGAGAGAGGGGGGDFFFAGVFELMEHSKNISLLCQVIGAQKTNDVEWTHDGVFQLAYTKIVNETYSSSQVEFTHVFKSMGGRYTCRAENDHGANAASIHLRIFQPGDQIDRNKNKTKDKTDGNNTTIVAVVSIAVVVILLIVLFLLVLLWRQMGRLKVQTERNLTPQEILEFFNGVISESAHASPSNEANGTALNSNVTGLPYNKKFEVLRHCLELYEKEILGSGEFGVVVRGFVVKSSGERERVAIKMAKKLGFDVSNLLALLSEIKIMAYLDYHENIVSLIAAHTENIANREAFAALEFCQNGNLLCFLKRARNSYRDLFNKNNASHLETTPLAHGAPGETVSTLTLLDFSRGVANALTYLTEKNIIHGDIAARNILLNSKLVPKLSDFGLSRQLVDYTNYIKKSKTALPWKWLALECLLHQEFSIKSDVWSYGVLLWEIWSLGQTPYPEFSLDQNFLTALTNGQRMKRPNHGNLAIYELMMDCWENEPKTRPQFKEIYTRIVEMYTRISTSQGQGGGISYANIQEIDEISLNM